MLFDDKDHPDRSHPRIPMSVPVLVTDVQGRTFHLETRDLSHGGAFLEWSDCDAPELPKLKTREPGERLAVQPAELGDPPDVSLDQTPEVQAEIVRVEDHGLAVRFLNER
ncbi:PilZ domain-containing protein [Thioalkalivibrio sp. ALE19]|uniref:PilZ domain-containing protein n=1 Tax=Thioalkalivibrio sp. ALE19 TaxID=1266909 RepID=UPI00048E3BE6|nr:PilZ domain-containing protein [Thioalkalivibrio sp. ALE19]